MGVLIIAVLEDYKPLFILTKDKHYSFFILMPTELRAEAELKTSEKPPGTGCTDRLQ